MSEVLRSFIGQIGDIVGSATSESQAVRLLGALYRGTAPEDREALVLALIYLLVASKVVNHD